MNIGGGSTWSDSGERWVVEYIAKSILHRRPVMVFDVGANVGNYAKDVDQILANFNLPHIIHSFEPSKITHARLVENTSGMSSIFCHNLALGSESATTTLYSNKPESGLASLYHRDLTHNNIEVVPQEQVRVGTLDEFCSKNNISTIDFLKIDVEGYELKVLQGAREYLERGKIEFIQFEFGGTAIDARIYLKDFFALLGTRYAIYRILKNGLYELPKYSEWDEIFITTNFLAVRK